MLILYLPAFACVRCGAQNDEEMATLSAEAAKDGMSPERSLGDAHKDEDTHGDGRLESDDSVMAASHQMTVKQEQFEAEKSDRPAAAWARAAADRDELEEMADTLMLLHDSA